MTDNVSDLKWLFSHLRVMCHSVMVDVITQAKRMEYYTVNTHIFCSSLKIPLKILSVVL